MSGTIALTGPSTTPGAPQITPAAINTAVNGALATKADALITATGSTRARLLVDRLSDFVNLLDYAVGDGSTDDTAAIQAAVTAARYKTLIVPAGHRFVLNATINTIGPMTIAGMGHSGGPGEVWEPGVINQNASEFICGTGFTTGDLFYCPSEYAVNFRDLLISSHVSLNFLTLTTRGSGAAIHLVGANTTGGTNANSSIERVAFSGFDVDIYLERCADTNISHCYFQAWKTAAIDVGTGGFAVESSPGHIAFNKFFGDVTPGTAQLQAIRTSAGYGGISHNLMVGSQTAIQVNANDLVNIGSMMIAFNSIEEQLAYGINIVQSGSTTIDAIQIQNNEFSNLTNKALVCHVNVTGASNAAIKTVSITGNKIQSFLLGGAGVCISMQTCTTGTISENLFNITGCYGISVGAVSSVDVLDNKIDGSGILGTSGYFFSAPGNVVLRDTSTRSIGAASIPNMADGSSLYIFDGKAVANGSAAVTSGGTGCIIWRIGGAWVTIPSARTAIDGLPIGQTTPAAITATTLSVFYNASGIIPAAGHGTMEWNYLNSVGEVDYWNTYGTVATYSHVWWQRTSGGAAIRLFEITTAGNVRAYGGIDNTALGATTPSTVVGTSIRTLSTVGPTWTGGTGAPGTTQPLGSMFSRTDGGVGTTLYVSRGGGTWNAVAGV